MTWFQITMMALQGFTLWKVLTMSNNSEAVDRLNASLARWTDTQQKAINLIDQLSSRPAGEEDVSAALDNVSKALDDATGQLSAVVTANTPAG